MLAMLKNIVVTAMMVAGATVAGAIGGACIVVIVTVLTPGASDPAAAILGGLIMIVLSILVGMFACIMTLPLAAVSMPPVLLVSHWLKLPRPLIDVIGGGAMGILSTSTLIEELSRDKFAGMISTTAGHAIVVLGLALGGFLGYLRHLALVRSRAAQPDLVPEPVVG